MTETKTVAVTVPGRPLIELKHWPPRAFAPVDRESCPACGGDPGGRPGDDPGDPMTYGALAVELFGVQVAFAASSADDVLDGLEHAVKTFRVKDVPQRLAPLLAGNWPLWPRLIRASRDHRLVFRILQALLCDLVRNPRGAEVPPEARAGLDRWAWCVAAGCLRPPSRQGRKKLHDAVRNLYIVSALIQLQNQFGIPIVYDGKRLEGPAGAPRARSGCEAVAERLGMRPAGVRRVWLQKPAELVDAIIDLQQRVRQQG